MSQMVLRKKRGRPRKDEEEPVTKKIAKALETKDYRGEMYVPCMDCGDGITGAPTVIVGKDIVVVCGDCMFEHYCPHCIELSSEKVIWPFFTVNTCRKCAAQVLREMENPEYKRGANCEVCRHYWTGHRDVNPTKWGNVCVNCTDRVIEKLKEEKEKDESRGNEKNEK